MALTIHSKESARTAVEPGADVTVLLSYIVTPETRVKILNAYPSGCPIGRFSSCATKNVSIEKPPMRFLFLLRNYNT